MGNGSDFLYKSLHENQDVVSNVVRNLTNFTESLLFKFLRSKGTATVYNNVDVTALRGAWAAGYQEALDDIEFFKEKFLLVESQKQTLDEPRFGWDKHAENKGYLSKEEIQKLKGTNI